MQQVLWTSCLNPKERGVLVQVNSSTDNWKMQQGRSIALSTLLVYTIQISWLTSLSQVLLPFTNHIDHIVSVCEKEVTYETGENQESVWAPRELYREKSKIQHSNVLFYSTPSLVSQWQVRIVPCISNGPLIPHLLLSSAININSVAGNRQQYRYLKHSKISQILEKYSSPLCGQPVHTMGPELYLFWEGQLSLQKNYERIERA